MGGLVATQGHGDAWAWAAAAGPMFGFMALMKTMVSVDVHDS